MALMSNLLIFTPSLTVMSMASSSSPFDEVLCSNCCSWISDMKQVNLVAFSFCLSFLGLMRPLGGFRSRLPVMRRKSTSCSFGANLGRQAHLSGVSACSGAVVAEI